MEHVIFGANLEIQGGEYGTATLSRFPIVEHENSHFEQLGPEQRGVLQTMIDMDGRSLLMINTHLDYRGSDTAERMLRSEERRVGEEDGTTSWPRDWSSDVCSSDLSGDPGRGVWDGHALTLSDC